jgi:phage shock protein A
MLSEENMKHIRRVKDIISANVQTALDKAENPEKMIRYLLTEMDEALEDLKASFAGRTAEKTRLDAQIKELEQTAARWSDRAELAIEKGKEDLAREALVEKKKAIRTLESLKQTASSLDSIITENRHEIDELKKKLETMETKQRSLVERGIHAQESLAVHRQIRDADSEDTYRRFSEIEHRIERMEAEAQMAGFNTAGSSEDRFKDLEGEDDIEQELADLKKKKSKTQKGE